MIQTYFYQIYEKVAFKYLTIPLLKPNAKPLFLKACICHLANDDLVGAKKACEVYMNEDPSFDGDRAQKLVKAITQTIEDKDEQGNQKVLFEYNKITPFDKILQKLLIAMKDNYFK